MSANTHCRESCLRLLPYSYSGHHGLRTKMRWTLADDLGSGSDSGDVEEARMNSKMFRIVAAISSIVNMLVLWAMAIGFATGHLIWK